MNPAHPRTQVFTAGVVKPVSSDGQNTERAKEQRSVATIPTRPPSEAHMTGEKHSDKHQNRHRSGPVNLHRPCLCAHFENTGGGDQIIPIRPCRAAKKKQRDHAVEQASVKWLQSDEVCWDVSHVGSNIQEGPPSCSSNNASAEYRANRGPARWRSANTTFVSASAVMQSAAPTVTLIKSDAARPVRPSNIGLTQRPRFFLRE